MRLWFSVLLFVGRSVLGATLEQLSLAQEEHKVSSLIDSDDFNAFVDVIMDKWAVQVGHAFCTTKSRLDSPISIGPLCRCGQTKLLRTMAKRFKELGYF